MPVTEVEAEQEEHSRFRSQQTYEQNEGFSEASKTTP